MKFECQESIDEEEINGKADIKYIVHEMGNIICNDYKYGEVILNADSICIEHINDVLMNTKCFAGWEHEEN